MTVNFTLDAPPAFANRVSSAECRLAPMIEASGYFRPLPLYTGARQRGCFTCAHFHGRYYSGHLICEHRGGVQIIGTPRNGCAYWERGPGADDE